MMKRRLKFPVWFWLFLLLGSPFWMCVEESPDLTRGERVRVDTLVARQTKVLRTDLDSICDEQFDREVERITDSILQVRLREIEAIIKRSN